MLMTATNVQCGIRIGKYFCCVDWLAARKKKLISCLLSEIWYGNHWIMCLNAARIIKLAKSRKNKFAHEMRRCQTFVCQKRISFIDFSTCGQNF